MELQHFKYKKDGLMKTRALLGGANFLLAGCF